MARRRLGRCPCCGWWEANGVRDGAGFIVRGALSLPLTQPVTFDPRAGDVTFKDASGAALHASALAVFGTYPRVRVEVPAPVAVYGYPVDLIEAPLTPVVDAFGPLF